MSPTLSVLLPVRNAQSTLDALVAEMLEVVADLTHRFELLIVDRGSTDATSEVAAELAVHFPQVRLLGGASNGSDTDLQAALRGAASETILFRPDGCTVPAAAVRRMWDSFASLDMLVALPRQRRAAALGRWLRSWSGETETELEAASQGWHLVRRAVAEGIRYSFRQPLAMIEELQRLGYRCGQLAIDGDAESETLRWADAAHERLPSQPASARFGAASPRGARPRMSQRSR